MKRVRLILTWLFIPLPLSWGRVRGDDLPAPQASAERRLDTLFATREYKEAAVSPDGLRVAWVETLPEIDEEPGGLSAVYVADLRAAPARPRRITAGDGHTAHAERGLAWSPDGSRLALLSDKDQPGQLQVYVAEAAGGEIRQVTQLAGYLTDPRWSPDGEQLAILFTENDPQTAGPNQPGIPEVGVVQERIAEQRLSVIEVGSGRMRHVSSAELYVYEYDWSPDGKRLVAIAAHGSGDNNWYLAQLYTLALDPAAPDAREIGASETRPLASPAMQIAMPRWSPDGRSIAFIGGLMSDEGINGGDLFVVPADGGEPHNLTREMKASASWLSWMPSSGELMFAEHVDGSSGIATLDVGSGRIATLWTGAETITAGARGYGVTPSVSLSADGKVSAAIRHSFDRLPEVWVGPPGDWKQITHANASLAAAWGKATSLHWKNDGQDVQGWLIEPPGFDSRRRYPMVTVVHGGPASAWKPRWPRSSDLTWLAGFGYFVFCPNPRGSFGQGEAFVRANVKDFGHGDLSDIRAGVEEVGRTAPIDQDRLGIAGWSYGGYMTMWTVTQTQRFRAAIAGAGIANWQSYYGQNEIDQWMIPYFGASVYHDPDVYARSSPMNFITRVKTPTLVLVGERDKECPAAQSREFWHALETLNVPTQLVIYPGEGHSIGKPAHRRDMARRSLAWFEKHLRSD